MKISGVILECNPFHSGHRYILEQAAAESDYTIAVMSGDFAQRGIPCIYAKEVRARDVLHFADLVLELPVFAAAASADLFAEGSIALLSSLGCVTDLYFGSESGDTDNLIRSAKVLMKETPSFKAHLKKYLASGLSFPLARQRALFDTEGIALPSSPNDLLGISYIRHLLLLQSSIVPHAVKRIPAESASDLRLQTKEGTFSGTHPELVPIFPDDFSVFLLARLLAEKDYSAFSDITPDLADRITNCLAEYRSFTGFCRLIKTRDVTWTRVSRCLLHLMLGIKKDDAGAFFSAGACGYARVLGFKKESAGLLTVLKKTARVLGFKKESAGLLTVLKKASRIPLITRVMQGDHLPSLWLASFKADLKASELWDYIFAIKSGDEKTRISEYKKKIIVEKDASK